MIQHSYIPNADDKLKVLKKLVYIRLVDRGGDPACYMIYVQDYDTPDIRYWCRQNYDRDVLIADMYNHYYHWLLSHCNVT